MGAGSHLDFGDFSPENSLMHSAAVAVKPDFSGWATKANLTCADGRVIMPDAFKHQDTMRVPLVWQHGHSEPSNVLGHMILENRDEGVYGYGYFNNTDQAKNAKTLVEHGDINALSIFANKLVEKAKKVSHGIIREVSLVLAGANPGALIDNIELQHADGDLVTIEDEAVIYTGEELAHGADIPKPGEKETPADEDDEDGPTVQDVYDKMSDEEKEVVHYMVGAALESVAGKKGDDDTVEHSATKDDKETRTMSRNVFESESGGKKEGEAQHTLSHDAVKEIVGDATRRGSLKEAVQDYAIKHGIEDIDVLFPDARTITATPEFDKRRTEWVSAVINGTRHSPFSRIKSIVADITHEEARARGYIKGTLKKEEYFGLTSRVTTPATVYKKQRLDRDDIIDITDFDVVAWLKAEMRLMLDEELARAVLVGDGRAVDDEDKIRDPRGALEGAGIRSIANDHDLYAATITIPSAASAAASVDAVIEAMRFYKGSGNPTLYTTLPMITRMLLSRDTLGRRLYRTKSDLAAEMGVNNIVEVEVMEGQEDLFGIIVNLNDYTLGADRGGDLAMFDDFDIDYNQYKYLIETRLSGALTKIRSALVIRIAAGDADLVDPASPAFNPATGAITITNQTGVEYRRADNGAVVNAAGSPYTVAPGASLTITAQPTAGNYFANNVEDEWTFEREA